MTTPPGNVRGAGDRWLRVVLPLSMVVAVVLRLLQWRSTAAIHNDGPVFIALAQAFASGDVDVGLSHEFHPLYPAAIAVVHLAAGPFGLGWEASAIAVSVLAGAGSVWALHAFVRSAFGASEAAVACALFAVHGGAVEMASDVQSEGLYMALFLVCAAVLWTALSTRSTWSAGLAGAMSGLAFLTRPEGVALAVVGGGLGLGALFTRRWPPRVALGFVAALSLGAGICVLPYVGVLHAETGELWLTRKKSIGWIAGVSGPPAHFAGERTVPDWKARTPAGMELPRPAEPFPQPSEPSPAEPAQESTAGSEAEWTVGDALLDLMRSMFRAVRYELLLFLVLGLAAMRPPPGLRAAFIGGVLGLHIVVLLGLVLNVGYVSTRHLMAPASLLLGYLACGVGVLGAVFARAMGRRWGVGAATALALCVTAGISFARVLREPDPDDLAQRRAAVWLRDHSGVRAPVAARRRRIAYYADAPFVKLRANIPERLVWELDAYAVRHVVVAEEDLADYPGLGAMIPRVLVPIHRESVGGETALVLRYEPGPTEKAPR
jgi:hypothetical protein